MPTYEFGCPAGHHFEKFYRKISDAPGTHECPTCGAVATRRVSGGAGLVFKGSGFYITDYGKDGKKDQKSSPRPSGDSRDSSSGNESTSGESSSSESSSSKSRASDSASTSETKGAGSSAPPDKGKSGNE